MADVVYGIHPAQEALRGTLRQPLELLLQRGAHNERVQALAEAARAAGVPVHLRERQDLDRLAGHGHHQGVVLRLSPFPYRELGDLLPALQATGVPPFLLVLDGITDPHNLGALVRSAECAGCQGVILGRDRACSVTPVVEKAAAGALAHLPLVQVTNISRALDQLKDAGLWVYGLAGEAEAQGLYATDLTGPLALVVGSEGEGVRPNVRKHCDGLLAIPMDGQLSSLNAAVAAGVALFEALRQRHAKRA